MDSQAAELQRMVREERKRMIGGVALPRPLMQIMFHPKYEIGPQ